MFNIMPDAGLTRDQSASVDPTPTAPEIDRYNIRGEYSCSDV